jgi:hypothetical protein
MTLASSLLNLQQLCHIQPLKILGTDCNLLHMNKPSLRLAKSENKTPKKIPQCSFRRILNMRKGLLNLSIYDLNCNRTHIYKSWNQELIRQIKKALKNMHQWSFIEKNTMLVNDKGTSNLKARTQRVELKQQLIGSNHIK